MSATHVDIKSDKEVMEMLSATLRVSFNRMYSIYVVDGRKSAEGMGSEHVGEKVVKNVETVKNSKSVVEKSNFKSATKIRNSTSMSKGKSVIEKNVEKNVVQLVEKRVVESVSNNVAISFGRSGSERVVKSTEKQGSETFSKNVSEAVSKAMTRSVDNNAGEAGSKSLSDSVEKNNMSGTVEKNLSGPVHEGVGSAIEVFGECEYESPSDGSYIPSSDEETDDEMEANELVSEDEEYEQCKRKMKERKKPFVITDEMFQGIVNGGQKSGYVSEYENSEDDDIYSDSTDFEDEGRQSRQRHAKVMYDPKCDHKLLTFSAGMGFIDGHRARDALTDNAVLNEWQIHFKRASKKELEAGR